VCRMRSKKDSRGKTANARNNAADLDSRRRRRRSEAYLPNVDEATVKEVGCWARGSGTEPARGGCGCGKDRFWAVAPAGCAGFGRLDFCRPGPMDRPRGVEVVEARGVMGCNPFREMGRAVCVDAEEVVERAGEVALEEEATRFSGWEVDAVGVGQAARVELDARCCACAVSTALMRSCGAD
jgi:hypothetical protein